MSSADGAREQGVPYPASVRPIAVCASWAVVLCLGAAGGTALIWSGFTGWLIQVCLAVPLSPGPFLLILAWLFPVIILLFSVIKEICSVLWVRLVRAFEVLLTARDSRRSIRYRVNVSGGPVDFDLSGARLRHRLVFVWHATAVHDLASLHLRSYDARDRDRAVEKHRSRQLRIHYKVYSGDALTKTPASARWIICVATKVLPRHSRERFAEEFSSELSELPQRLRLQYAGRQFLRSMSLRYSMRRRE